MMKSGKSETVIETETVIEARGGVKVKLIEIKLPSQPAFYNLESMDGYYLGHFTSKAKAIAYAKER